MKNFLLIASLVFMHAIVSAQPAQNSNRNFFELRIYHFANAEQQTITEDFLQHRYIDFLHKSGIKDVGVFKPLGDDTASNKKLYLLIPYASLKQFDEIKSKMPEPFIEKGKAFVNATHDKPAFTRIEAMLLKAFTHMPQMEKPSLSSLREERVYELRSYESPSERIFQNKVHMFNEGGEITLFKRLGFNAVFYSEALIGNRLPNLVYMVTFNSMKEREEHWKAFGADAEWKRLSALPQYQNNVSKIDNYFLRPTSYSDY
jgi:hypothetical protein